MANLSIEIKDLLHVYKGRAGSVVALRGVNFSLAEGEICIIRGLNGSGKSTLVDVISKNLIPISGQVEVNGSVRTLRQFENAFAELTVREYLKMATLEVSDVLAAWNLSEFAEVKLGSISPGNRQLISVAGILASKPKVLIADEPAGSLSQSDAKALYEKIVEHCRTHQISLLLVTHDTNSEKYADRVVRISDGRISEQWTPGENEESLVDQHGWLRIPRSLGINLPATSRIKLNGEKVILEGLHFEPEVSMPTALTSITPENRLNLTVPIWGIPVSIEVSKGKVTSLCGGVGSGKTWALRHWQNLASEHLSSNEANSKCAMFAQDIAGDLSLFDIGANAYYIEALGAKSFANRPLRTLSGGQRQKALLASAFSSDCEYLLIDDPLRALDEESRTLVIELLSEISDKGVLVASDDLELQEHSNLSINLDQIKVSKD